jgi:hypothetical protein
VAARPAVATVIGLQLPVANQEVVLMLLRPGKARDQTVKLLAHIAIKQPLSRDQRDYLSEIAKSHEVVSSIEARLRNSHKKYIVRAVSTILLTLALFIWPIVQATTYTFAAGFVGYFVGLITAVVLVARHREYFTFMDIVDSVTKAEQAKRTVPGSRRRLSLGKKLVACSKRMRSFSARIPIQLPKRIMAEEAKQCALVLRRLIYPVMLGTDEELDQVKGILAQAALRVGAGNWVQIRTLEAKGFDYPSVKGAPEWISAPMLLPVATALLPPLIGILAHL